MRHPKPASSEEASSAHVFTELDQTPKFSEITDWDDCPAAVPIIPLTAKQKKELDAWTIPNSKSTGSRRRSIEKIGPLVHNTTCIATKIILKSICNQYNKMYKYTVDSEWMRVYINAYIYIIPSFLNTNRDNLLKSHTLHYKVFYTVSVRLSVSLPKPDRWFYPLDKKLDRCFDPLTGSSPLCCRSNPKRNNVPYSW